MKIWFLIITNNENLDEEETEPEGPPSIEILGLQFILTSTAFPEQYDVKDKHGNQVGYIRLRNGAIICRYPDVSGPSIYHKDFRTGCGFFENELIRQEYLRIIAAEILKKMEKTEHLTRLFKKVREDSSDGIQDFLGYPLTAVFLDDLDERIEDTLNQMSDEQVEYYEQKYFPEEI